MWWAQHLTSKCQMLHFTEYILIQYYWMRSDVMTWIAKNKYKKISNSTNVNNGDENLFFMKSHRTIFKTKIDYFWKQKKPDLSLYILKKCEFIIIAGLYPVSIRIKQKLEPLCLRSKPDDLAIDRAINHLGDIFH